MLPVNKRLDTVVLRILGAVALILVSSVSTPLAYAGSRCAVPASDPDAMEVREAMRIVGLGEEAPEPVAKAIDQACFSGTELALYDHLVRVILVGDDWREVGGLTRLIHEMQHYADDLAGLRGEDECAATRVAAAWADEHNYFNEARRERRYGAAACEARGAMLIAGAMLVPTGDSGDGTTPGRMIRASQSESVMFLPPED
jgi:hypothetical protein